ncbi:hypothetical protein, partial [Aeromicrobium sp.]
MTRRSGPTFRRAACAVAAVATAAALTACQEVVPEEREFKSEAKLTSAKSGGDHKIITLTQT